ncbi:MAG: hypothetical protein IJW99_06285, partial [Clostridia bacterium]|nr:hypothetical protein [Clostridia bacterium]
MFIYIIVTLCRRLVNKHSSHKQHIPIKKYKILPKKTKYQPIIHHSKCAYCITSFQKSFHTKRDREQKFSAFLSASVCPYYRRQASEATFFVMEFAPSPLGGEGAMLRTHARVGQVRFHYLFFAHALFRYGRAGHQAKTPSLWDGVTYGNLPPRRLAARGQCCEPMRVLGRFAFT